MTLRQNIRNYLVGLTIAEVQRELAGAIERGEDRRAEYIGEFLDDLEEEFNACETDDDWDDGDEAIRVAEYF